MSYAYHRSPWQRRRESLSGERSSGPGGRRDRGTRSLRLYVLLVGLAGAGALGITAAAGGVAMDRVDVLVTLALSAAGAVAVCPRLRWTQQTTVDIGTAVYVAMLLLLPWAVVGLAATAATVGGDLLRTRGRMPDRLEFWLNAGQTAVAVSAAAGVFAATRALVGDGSGEVGLATAIVLAATVLMVVNAGLVAVAVGLLLRIVPWRLWGESLRADLMTHANLTAMGIIGAILAIGQPLALPLMVLPSVQMYRVLRGAARLREDMHQALAALADVVELRDPYTAGHSRRVANLARELAMRLGLTDAEADGIQSAGRVHDLGKLALDPSILTKTGSLSAEEWAEIRSHPAQGARVISRFGAFGEGYRIVRHHHEAWDGTGYPDRLAGEAIPIGARILAVADTFDTLTRGRSYRSAESIASTRSLLREGAGRQWDARVVEALLGYLDEGSGAAGRGAAGGG